MAVLESNQTVSNNRNGFDKEISKSARTMMLDNIQNFIYQKPIPSCVRETVSNCIDATNEKLVALKILNGELKVSDVYKTLDDVEVAKEGDNIYEDSEFKADYYDPKWLSSDNKITIKYAANSVMGEKDMFSITDNGVGIGGARLEGIFSLGFSTKRLNTNELGGFGIGQKSALATGVASYRMITRHNGKEFTFDIFSHKVENANTKWAEDETLNPYIEFDNTWVDTGRTRQVVNHEGDVVDEPVMEKFKAFYKPTTEKNGTTIEFEVKPHNKQQFFDAVKSQLMYLKDDIDFVFVDPYGREQYVPFKQDTIYEDDNVILSNYGYFNRPHFVIKGIAYGIIDFQEAELSPKFGNIGFKFRMEDLDVLPSREGVRYTQRTTGAIVNLYEKNKATVTKMIQDELNETRFFPWLRSASKIAHRAGNGNSSDVVSRLSSLADQSEIDLKYNETVKYSSSFKEMFGPLLSLQVMSMDYRRKINREPSDYTLSLTEHTHFQFGPSSSRTSAYLMVSNSNIPLIRAGKEYAYLAPKFAALISEELSDEDFIKESEELIDTNEVDETKRTNIKVYLAKAHKMLKLMNEDKLVPSYDTVEVPEDFSITEDVTEDTISDALDAERRKNILKERKANKEFYIQKIERSGSWSDTAKLTRHLVKFSELDRIKSEGCELVYFTEDMDAKLVHAILSCAVTSSSEIKPFNSDKLLIFKVAKSNVKQVKDIAVLLDEWFYNIDEDGTLKFAPVIRGMINKGKSYSGPNWGRKHVDLVNQGFSEKLREIDKINSDVPTTNVYEIMQYVAPILDFDKLAKSYDNDYESEKVSAALVKLNETVKFPKDVLKVEFLNEDLIQLSTECKDFDRVYGKFLNSVDIQKIKTELEIILQTKKDELQFKFKGLHDDFNS